MHTLLRGPERTSTRVPPPRAGSPAGPVAPCVGGSAVVRRAEPVPAPLVVPVGRPPEPGDDPRVGPRAVHREMARLRPLLAAEAAAEEVPGTIEAADLEQAVWLRLLELREPPAEPFWWLRAAVRAEVCRALREDAGRMPYDACDIEPAGRTCGRGALAVEDLVITAELRHRVRAAVARLPGRCPQVVTAMMSRSDPTYQEISRELGISQGSLGPLRSRCLGCLRTILVSGGCAPGPMG